MPGGKRKCPVVMWSQEGRPPFSLCPVHACGDMISRLISLIKRRRRSGLTSARLSEKQKKLREYQVSSLHKDEARTRMTHICLSVFRVLTRLPSLSPLSGTLTEPSHAFSLKRPRVEHIFTHKH